MYGINIDIEIWTVDSVEEKRIVFRKRKAYYFLHKNDW